MSEQTFGAWLLAQTAREDSIGSMARSWKQLKEARGYKHSQEKSVRELLSSMFGEDWANMQGDEVMNAAVAEWRGDFDDPTHPAIRQEQQGQTGQTTIFDLPAGAAALLAPPGPPPSPQMVVLVVDGFEYELTPGRRYVLDFGAPVLRDVEGFEQPAEGGQPTPWLAVEKPVLSTDGHLDWTGLFRSADLTAAPEE